MKNPFIIGGILALFIVLISGAYFFANKNKPEDLSAKKDKIQSDLAVAKNKLDQEKQTLDIMMNELQNSFPLAVGIQTQMKKASSLVKQTDFMFTDANGLNPEMIIGNFSTSILINDERKNINLLISSWQKEVDISSITKIDITESEKIKKDAETIKIYIEDLSKIVKSLTPENSGLSQSQIDTYLSQLPSVEEINEVLVSMETAIENANNSGGSSSSITPEDILAEQAAITDAQNQAADLQEQLTQIEQQTDQGPSLPPETDITTNPNSENQNTNNGNNSNDYAAPYDSRNVYRPNPSIIIQPGPPELIQGSNQY